MSPEWAFCPSPTRGEQPYSGWQKELLTPWPWEAWAPTPSSRLPGLRPQPPHLCCHTGLCAEVGVWAQVRTGVREGQPGTTSADMELQRQQRTCVNVSDAVAHGVGAPHLLTRGQESRREKMGSRA